MLPKRNAQPATPLANGTHDWDEILLAAVGNVQGPTLAHPPKPSIVDTHFDAARRYGYGTNMSSRDHHISLTKPQHHVVDAANPGGALDDGVEHRLHVGGRAADDAQHFRCRSLMLQRFTQFCVALLDFLEQAHVLDGDDGLVGKGFE